MAAPKKPNKYWKYTKRTIMWGSIFLVIRETYLALGPRRERRRAVYALAARRAAELGKPLLVLGDPDGGLIHHALGRDFQCGDLCVDPKGCGICPDWLQGRAEDALANLQPNSHVIFDPGAFAKADSGTAIASQMLRVAGPDVFMADAGPWTLTAFFGPRRKRRLLEEPQISQGVIGYRPLLWHSEPDTGRDEVRFALAGSTPP